MKSRTAVKHFVAQSAAYGSQFSSPSHDDTGGSSNLESPTHLISVTLCAVLGLSTHLRNFPPHKNVLQPSFWGLISLLQTV